jgi:protein-disulfide isomerase
LTPEVAAHLVRPHSPVLGAANARVTVVEVLDPACEACRAFAPVVEQLLFLYPNDVRVVVRFADFHPPSLDAIRLLEAAHRGGCSGGGVRGPPAESAPSSGALCTG